MKKLLSVLFTLFFTATVYADCAGTGLWVFPSEQTIKQNSIFVLDGYAESQHIVLGLNKSYAIYLKSGNTKIKLIVQDTHSGQFYLTQAILKPEKTLVAGLEYILCIDNLPEYERFGRYNSTKNEYEPIKYTVSKGIDMDKPIVVSSPKEVDKSYVQFGCGPAMSVNFSFQVNDSSPLIVKTTVKNIKTGIETTYCILPSNGQIQVGHGMCSGAFVFDNNNNYEIEFSFIDASGNVTAWKGERLKFTKPTDENWEDWKKQK